MLQGLLILALNVVSQSTIVTLAQMPPIVMSATKGTPRILRVFQKETALRASSVLWAVPLVRPAPSALFAMPP